MGEVSYDEGDQVGAHVDAGLFKLIFNDVIGKLCGFGLRYKGQYY